MKICKNDYQMSDKKLWIYKNVDHLTKKWNFVRMLIMSDKKMWICKNVDQLFNKKMWICKNIDHLTWEKVNL